MMIATCLNPANASVDAPSRSLSLRNVSIAYGKSAVVGNVTHAFAERSVTAIMGPSGCGKSTLLKALNRTLELCPGARVTAGSIVFDEVDLYAPGVDAAAVRTQIGIIHQRPLPFPMSILENVLFGVRYHRPNLSVSLSDYAATQLERVGLWDEVKGRLHRPASELSGGQQQRLCLARTLANQSRIILMDEPCSALDPASTRRIEELISELKKEVTLIVVTHNMSQARRISDEAIFMYEGSLVEAGSSQVLFENPAEKRTAEFVRGEIG